ncbi:DNA repair protein RecO [Alcanivorax sp. 1008]|uniref:DNA repair protein RecO n=1 Tax=Alcanivorax sp. 1008 TaxID=2816853 RepID=UPI001D4E0749|nr:DNA repair protein RecO [Alcanivorax sp. 1008]MCC1495610.1 DNA repair protein RecO [Alcanivorax sp. 1008]
MATSEKFAPFLCWVLHRRPYRNTSVIVDLLSADSGRVAAIARGGQRQPLLQPFRPLWVEWRGRGELRSLGAIEPAGVAFALQGEALYCGLYLNEMLVRLLHRDDAHPELQEVYAATLAALAAKELPVDIILRHFELRLLDLIGYGLSLDQDANGQPLLSGLRYRLSPGQGLLLDVSGPFSGEILNDIAAGHWHDEARRLARDLMREALSPHLGGRPLVSRSLFRNAGKGAS